MRLWPWQRRRGTAAPTGVERATDAPTPTDANAELRQLPGWWVRLAGERFDLDALVALRLKEIEVRRLDGRYYLRAEAFANVAESSDVERAAEEIVGVLNGAARVEHGNSREVRVDASTRVNADGRIENFVSLAATITGRSRLTVTLSTGRKSQEVQSVAARVAENALQGDDRVRALTIFGRDGLDWRDLFYIVEIAEAALGGALYADGTVSGAEIRRFTHTAQSPTVLGEKARHGHERTEPPTKPMPFDEARSLVGRVLKVWLDSQEA